MAFQYVAAALQLRVGDPYSKLLLLALADRAEKETGQCWPSLARLAEDTHLSVATIKRKLNFLEERGFITRVQRDQQSTLYTLAHPELTMSLWRRGWLTPSQGVAHSELGGRLTVSHEPISKNLSENQILFEEFWERYPRKTGKGQARKAFEAAMKKATQEEVMEGLDRFLIASQGTEARYIPHASTWLNGERWLDEVESGWGNALDDL